MSQVRLLKLVFLIVDPDVFRGEAQRKLAKSLNLTAKGFLDFLDSPPTIRCPRFPEHGWYMSSSYAPFMRTPRRHPQILQSCNVTWHDKVALEKTLTQVCTLGFGRAWTRRSLARAAPARFDKCHENE